MIKINVFERDPYLREKIENLLSHACVLHMTSNLIISHCCRDENSKAMYQSAHAGRAKPWFLLIERIVLWRHRPCLKLPNVL